MNGVGLHCSMLSGKGLGTIHQIGTIRHFRIKPLYSDNAIIPTSLLCVLHYESDKRAKSYDVAENLESVHSNACKNAIQCIQ